MVEPEEALSSAHEVLGDELFYQLTTYSPGDIAIERASETDPERLRAYDEIAVWVVARREALAQALQPLLRDYWQPLRVWSCPLRSEQAADFLVECLDMYINARCND